MIVIRALIAWIRGARWRASVMHLLEMWLVILPVWLITDSRPAAAAAVVAWYWSRKMTEVRALASPGNLSAAWNKGWLPWQWPHDLQLDFYLPTAAVLFLNIL